MINRKLFLIFIIIFSSILTFIFLESFLRYINNEKEWNVTREANILRNFKFNYYVGNLYQANYKYVLYERDKYGLRDNCNSLDQIKILTVGGSTTDQRFVPLSSTFQSVIQNRISLKADKFICVSNAGVDGHSTFGHIFSFNKWFPLIPFNPKYIILYVGINDINLNRVNIPNVEDKIKNVSVKDYIKKLEIVQRLLPLYRFLNQVNLNQNIPYANHIAMNYKTNDYWVSQLNPYTKLLTEKNNFYFKRRFQAIINFVRAWDAVPICVTHIHRYTKNINGKKFGISDVFDKNFSGLDFDYSLKSINSEIANLCGKHIINLNDYNFKDDHFYDGVHTTPSGSEFIGNILSDYIINNNLLINLEDY